MPAIPCGQYIASVVAGEGQVVGIAQQFGRHKFVLKINADNFSNLQGVFQLFEWLNEVQSFVTANRVRHELKLFNDNG